MKALHPVFPPEDSEGKPTTPAAFNSLHSSHKIYLQHSLHACADCMDAHMLDAGLAAGCRAHMMQG